MKKILLPLVCVMVMVHSTRAQEFQSGTNMINAGIGLGSSLGGFGYTSQTPALSISYEKGMWEVAGPGVIGLGGYLGYKSFKYSTTWAPMGVPYSYTQKWSYLIIGLRSAYHYNGLDIDKLDIYGGAMLSFDNLNYKYSDTNPSGDYDSGNSYGSGFSLSIYAGGRYMFTDNIGGFLEAGYGISYLSLGVAFKF